jgi:hypothetical protein
MQRVALFEQCRVQDLGIVFEGFAVIRAAATMLLVEFMVVCSCWEEP